MSCDDLRGRKMDVEASDPQSRSSRSLGRTSSSGASLRRHSFSLSGRIHPRLDEDAESEIGSLAGDIGDRELSSRRKESFGLHFYETGVTSNTEDGFLQSMSSPVTPLPSEEDAKALSPALDYISCLIHLAFFGILGVLTRYLLQKLFGPGVIGVTRDGTILYLDLPSNMVGSFLMGWLGVVFKGDISRFSDQLAIGLSTGYLGSLTTFSGWNQKMLDLSVKGHWVFAVLGYLIGLFLAAYSIILGIETAQSFRCLISKTSKDPKDDSCSSKIKRRVVNCNHHVAVMVILILAWALLFAMSVVLESKEFRNGGGKGQLWLACLVAPLGVWIRWWLARLNGHGLGKRGWFKWIPFGTLAANVSAACIMAILATVKKAVQTQDCDTVANGIQFGLLGCLSTVSTFISEYNAMRSRWRAYAYAVITFGVSFALGTLLYSVPVWAKGYK